MSLFNRRSGSHGFQGWATHLISIACALQGKQHHRRGQGATRQILLRGLLGGRPDGSSKRMNNTRVRTTQWTSPCPTEQKDPSMAAQPRPREACSACAQNVQQLYFSEPEIVNSHLKHVDTGAKPNVSDITYRPLHPSLQLSDAPHADFLFPSLMLPALRPTSMPHAHGKTGLLVQYSLHAR